MHELLLREAFSRRNRRRDASRPASLPLNGAVGTFGATRAVIAAGLGIVNAGSLAEVTVPPGLLVVVEQ